MSTFQTKRTDADAPNDGSRLTGSAVLPAGLARHRGFAQIFQPNKLTFGFIAPLEGYPDSPSPTLENHVDIVRKADEIGIAALWLRDVPFYDPSFGDVGQIMDPMVYAGFLATVTRRMTIGTAGIILPLRDPLIVAKQATSVDQLLGGRFLLGLAGGDRPEEFPAFGVPFADRVERYRDARALIAVVTEQDFPEYRSQYFGALTGTLDLIPKPAGALLPAVAIGRSGQTVEWIAANMDAWIWHGSDARRMADIVPRWLKATDGTTFKPYGYATWFDLAEDPDAPAQHGRVLRAGRHALVDFWREQEKAGISHVVLNLKPTRRPAGDILEELAEYVLPHFPAHTLRAT
jgi:luciferase-type oxidoreductase